MDESREVIDPALVITFVSEAQFKIETADTANRMAHGALEAHQLDAFWYHLDVLMGSITAVANIFWPSTTKGPAKRRGRFLVTELGLTSAIAPSVRDTRNKYIHFDEYLDKWYRESEAKNFVDRNVLGPDDISGIEASDFARNFDPEAWQLSVFGHEADLRSAMATLGEISSRALEWKSRRDPWGHPLADQR